MRLGTRYRWFAAAYGLLGAAQIALHWRDPVAAAIEGGGLLLIGAAWVFLPLTVVDDHGITQTRPRRTGHRLRWKETIPWEQVAEIVQPHTSSMNRALRVRLHDGRLISLRYATSDRARDLSRIGQRPLLTAADPSTPVTRQPPPRPTRPSEAEEQRALDRRLQRLQQERAQLRRGLHRRD